MSFPRMFALSVDLSNTELDLAVARKAVDDMYRANPDAPKIMFAVSCKDSADNAKLDEAIGKLKADLQNPENAKLMVEIGGKSREVVMKFDEAFLEAELLS